MDVSVNEYAVSEEETRTSEAMSFEEAVRAYGDAVTRACLVHLHDRSCAEDCWQETFLALYRTQKVLRRSPDAVRAWLLRVAMNKCADENRRASRAYAAEVPEARLARSDEYPAELLSLLDTLPEKIRQCVYLYYYEQYQVAEIARITGRPEGTVKARLKKGRELLKGELNDGCTK